MNGVLWGPAARARAPHHPSPTLQQSKIEDHLDEAIHVLRSHAVGTAGDMHTLLPGHGALASGFASPMSLGGRHAGLVSTGRGWGWAVGRDLAPPDAPLSHACRLEADTLRMALQAAPASCTITRPSPASRAPSLTSHGLPTPTAVSP